VVKEINSELLYEPENYQTIADSLQKWQNLAPDFIEAIRQKGIQLSSEYAEDKYHAKFKTFLNHILNEPVISKHPIPPRAALLSDMLPFAALRRYNPKGFFNYRVQP
jgi:hypothetical protein